MHQELIQRGFLHTISRGRPGECRPVGRALARVDELIRETLCDRFDVPERRLPGSRGEQHQRLVHTAQRGDIHSLPLHHTGGSDTGGILAGPTGEDKIEEREMMMALVPCVIITHVLLLNTHYFPLRLRQGMGAMHSGW